MRRLAILLAACIGSSIGACTVVKINKDDTTTIEHKAGADVAQDLSNRACRKAGQQVAVIISTINKDASLPQGTGKQVTTFRCTSGSTR